jgi:hypothetical protein
MALCAVRSFEQQTVQTRRELVHANKRIQHFLAIVFSASCVTFSSSTRYYYYCWFEAHRRLCSEEHDARLLSRCRLGVRTKGRGPKRRKAGRPFASSAWHGARYITWRSSLDRFLSRPACFIDAVVARLQIKSTAYSPCSIKSRNTKCTGGRPFCLSENNHLLYKGARHHSNRVRARRRDAGDTQRGA